MQVKKQSGSVTLTKVLTEEEFCEIKLAVLDLSLDSLVGEQTERGKEAAYRIGLLFRPVFVQEIRETMTK